MNLEKFIAYFFVGAITLALILIGVGAIQYFYEDFIRENDPLILPNPQKIPGIIPLVFSALKGQRWAFVYLGILTLILTPLCRVLICHLYFLSHHKLKLAIYTLFSLILLILSSLGFIQIG